MVKCPYCGFEGEHRLLKTWKYAAWNVLYYECLRCSSRFGFYVDPEGRRRSFTVGFKPRVR